MIKGSFTNPDGSEGLFIGLSARNVSLLLAGHPIKFDTAELGLPPITVVIAGGQTEEQILDDTKDAFANPDTPIERRRHATNHVSSLSDPPNEEANQGGTP